MIKFIHFRYITDGAHRHNATICNTGDREKHIYSFEGHSVDVQIIPDGSFKPDDKDKEGGHFMLKYKSMLIF